MSIHIRKFTETDLPFADQVRQIAGWNQTAADWRRLLDWDPEGCFVAEWEGRPAGTATTTRYGTGLAWIGMVLVHPDLRRRGIGKALLSHCIDHLQNLGVACIKLDATPLGKPLYDQLGFEVEWELARYHAELPPHRTPGIAPDNVTRENIGPWPETIPQELSELDRRAFGADRLRHLNALARDSLLARAALGARAGYAMLRQGTRANYVGPAIADAPGTAVDLVTELVTNCPPGSLFWDIPDANAPAVSLATRLGFQSQRRLIRMFLGENRHPSDPALQAAIADPAIG